jgi:hypothetical protein
VGEKAVREDLLTKGGYSELPQTKEAEQDDHHHDDTNDVEDVVHCWVVLSLALVSRSFMLGASEGEARAGHTEVSEELRRALA